MSRDFILLSPGPIDGYPPVQYQARILADSGHRVQVVTAPFRSANPDVAFSHPGVRICSVKNRHPYVHRMHRSAAFFGALVAARMRANRARTVEIAYDPIGMLYSDLVPLRPNHRVAHFHELLQYADQFLEKRLRHSIHAYNLVVVADPSRASHTRETLALIRRPLVVENYPLLGKPPTNIHRVDPQAPFEVAYCGTLGFDQKLDIVIQSVPDWPAQASLILIGNTETEAARKLRELVVNLGLTGRVHFAGWLNICDAEARLQRSNLAIALLDASKEQWRTALGASNKRYQYMKAGLPQIGDQCPGVPDLIEGEGIGTCIARHSEDRIAEVVAAYVRNPDRCISEGTRAFHLHATRFHYEKVFQRVTDALDAS